MSGETADMQCDSPSFEAFDDVDMSQYDDIDGPSTSSDLQRMKNMALWILKLKEKRKLTQV